LLTEKAKHQGNAAGLGRIALMFGFDTLLVL
jgi:hypothetical protein